MSYGWCNLSFLIFVPFLLCLYIYMSVLPITIQWHFFFFWFTLFHVNDMMGDECTMYVCIIWLENLFRISVYHTNDYEFCCCFCVFFFLWNLSLGIVISRRFYFANRPLYNVISLLALWFRSLISNRWSAFVDSQFKKKLDTIDLYVWIDELFRCLLVSLESNDLLIVHMV